MLKSELPFYVGQEVEAKTFELGYRGGWFRCKILKISTKKGETWFDLQYFDFPDEAITPTKLYQYLDRGGVSVRKKHLMVRPKFPAHYRESEIQNIDMIFEETIIFNDNWRIGDVVDWWHNTIYWSGTITGFKESGEILLMFLPQPVGEGGEDCALSKDLRPTLNWSLENGWTVRSPRCAKLIRPLINGSQPSCNNHNDSLEVESLLHVKKTHEDDSADRKKMNVDDEASSITMESVVSNLVVLSCEMKKLKGIVKMGGPSARSSLPSWKFVEHRAPPM